MELQYDNILIRNAAITDADLLASWWNDGTTTVLSNRSEITSTEIISQIRRESDTTVRRYLILIDDKRIGEMMHRQLNRRTCEIGFKICLPEFQNRGYGKNALSLFVSGLFDCLGYEKIQINMDLRNYRAQHVCECLGFSRLGVNLGSWVDEQGTARSSVSYEVTPETFISSLEE